MLINSKDVNDDQLYQNGNVVQDKTKKELDRHIGYLVSPPVVMTALSYFLIDKDWLTGLCTGVGFGLLWCGIPKKIRNYDTSFIRTWKRPSWLRTTAFVLFFFSVCAFLFDTVPTHYNLYAAALAFVGVVISGGRNWGSIFKTIGERIGVVKPLTEEEVILKRFEPFMFDQSGIKKSSNGTTILPDIIEKKLDDHGLPSIDIAMIPGTSERLYGRNADELATAWGVPLVVFSKGTVIREGEFKNRTKMTMTARTTIRSVQGNLAWEPIPNAAEKSITEYVKALNIAKFVDSGDDLLYDLSEKNIIISGVPGSGKSSITNTLLRFLIAHPHARIAFIDMKAGVEAEQWRNAVNMVVSNSPSLKGGIGAKGVLKFLLSIQDEMEERYGRMAEKGVTNAWTENFLDEDEPLKFIIIDEFPQLINNLDAKTADETETVINSLLTRGRAAGYVLVIIAQYPVNQNVPTTIRENFSDMFCFRSKTDKGWRATLGVEWEPATKEEDPTLLRKGEAVFRNEDYYGSRIKARFWELKKEEKKEVLAKESVIGGKPFLDNENIQEEILTLDADGEEKISPHLKNVIDAAPPVYPAPKTTYGVRRSR